MLNRHEQISFKIDSSRMSKRELKEKYRLSDTEVEYYLVKVGRCPKTMKIF
jgi:hypothetical protein